MKSIPKKSAGMIPGYSLFPLILAVLFNTAVYNGARMIAGEWYHYNLESALDRMIPFWPPAIVVYLGCYLFWAVNYIIIARQRKKEAYQFFKCDFLSRIICLLCFLSFPTTNIRPFVESSGLWNQAVLWLYSVDAADNLFPSIHCLVSWLCYIGIRRNPSVPVWYRGFSCIMALLVCASTLLTKQHVLVDVIGGVLLAELCFYIGKRNEDTGIYGQIMDKINRRLRLEKGSV
ncbi:MAG: phosphatase PAP2 family protein [Lachnospiraceae bacterium]